MKDKTPEWALRRAASEDYEVIQDSHRRGTIRINWPDLKALRIWAKGQQWPTPWFGFEKAFITRMLESKVNFALALSESGIKISISRQEFSITAEKIKELDEMYEERSSDGSPTDWGSLVEDLREIRRAVEAGVAVEIDGRTFRQSGSFYNWVHERYHMLEDGYDSWVGDDN